MTRIQTYVFLDIETTGEDQTNRTKVTEISLIAVKRLHLLDTRIGFSPRVQHKLTLCLNPRKMINPLSTETTGLCNDLLEYEPTFDINLFNLLNTFLNLFTKPICLIAQNGLKFDFPILRNHLEKLGVSFAEDLNCADCFHAFYDIMQSRKITAKEASTLVDTDENLELYFNISSLEIQAENERSPSHYISTSPVTPQKRKQERITRVVRRFPWSDSAKPKEKYKLKHIYERLLNRPAQNAHRAENDCLFALECAVALSEEFVKWVDDNKCLFSQIKPMTIGVPLGE